MARLLLVVAVLVSQVSIWAQATSVLRVTVTQPDAAQAPAPVERYALLISDNPATGGPKRVLTSADGTAEIALRPGSYIVESDRPFITGGKAYQWTVVVELSAGREVSLQLSASNADEVALPAVDAATPGSASDAGPASLSLLATWESSVVAVWTPTARASGFVIDPGGLVATDASAIGSATTVAVQLTDAQKVPARVLVANAATGAAIVWIDPAAVALRTPLTFACPPDAAAALDDDDEIAAIEAPFRRRKDVALGAVSALAPLAIETDLRLSFGGAGGPVFNDTGTFVGSTSLPRDTGDRRPGDAIVVRSGFVCEAAAAARANMAGGTAPAATSLPLEPPDPVREERSTSAATTAGAMPLTTSSSEFDIAFITPPVIEAARARADRSGAVGPRSAEAEARLGRLTDFGAWTPYFADAPPLVVVRVAPKLVEGFWKRLAREAARLQGAVLPPFRNFATSFRRMRAACGDTELAPIHPFVLEHRVSETTIIREGLYVFDPESFTSECADMTLTLYDEKTSDRGETVPIDGGTLERLRRDFAPVR